MNHTVSFRVDDDTFRRVKTLSHVQNRSVSECLRRLVFQEYIRQDLNNLEEDGIPSHAETEEFLREFNKINQEE